VDFAIQTFENEPLDNPIKVLRFAGSKLPLADSRLIEIQNFSDDELMKGVAESDFLLMSKGPIYSSPFMLARTDGFAAHLGRNQSQFRFLGTPNTKTNAI
jgi:hypothetical protein